MPFLLSAMAEKHSNLSLSPAWPASQTWEMVMHTGPARHSASCPNAPPSAATWLLSYKLSFCAVWLSNNLKTAYPSAGHHREAQAWAQLIMCLIIGEGFGNLYKIVNPFAWTTNVSWLMEVISQPCSTFVIQWHSFCKMGTHDQAMLSHQVAAKLPFDKKRRWELWHEFAHLSFPQGLLNCGHRLQTCLNRLELNHVKLQANNSKCQVEISSCLSSELSVDQSVMSNYYLSPNCSFNSTWRKLCNCPSQGPLCLTWSGNSNPWQGYGESPALLSYFVYFQYPQFHSNVTLQGVWLPDLCEDPAPDAPSYSVSDICTQYVSLPIRCCAGTIQKEISLSFSLDPIHWQGISWHTCGVCGEEVLEQ